MKIDPYRCTMEQIDPDSLSPQKVADIIFEARDIRLDCFDRFYQPLDPLTPQERDYCLQHENEITQSLDTTEPTLIELIESIDQLVEKRAKALRMRSHEKRNR